MTPTCPDVAEHLHTIAAQLREHDRPSRHARSIDFGRGVAWAVAVIEDAAEAMRREGVA